LSERALKVFNRRNPSELDTMAATLNVIFISLHSLLDYTTKLVHEIEHLRSDFSTYPKPSSSSIQFGDRRRTGWGEAPGTPFEPSEAVRDRVGKKPRHS
jgi:hypothetical protein